MILDRGYCDAQSIQYLIDEKIPYVIMVKGMPEGYETVLEKDQNKIRLNMEYHIEGTLLFGIQEKVKLFKDFIREDYLTLFYDCQNASGRITALLKKVDAEKLRLEKEIRKGKIPSISAELASFLEISSATSPENSTYKVQYTPELQKIINEKGFYSIVTSAVMTPFEVHSLYSSRGASEKQYMYVKSQLGYGKVRVYYTSGVIARFQVGFIASVIRHELERAAKAIDRDACQMIREIDLLEMQKINDSYTYTHTESLRTRSFFSKLDIELKTLLDEVVKDSNDRLQGIIPIPRHRKTGSVNRANNKPNDDKKPDDGRDEAKENQEDVTGKKPGPKLGYKHTDINVNGAPRKKPGVKPGTKRGEVNKDGSPRKKPGSKQRAAQN